jgi:AcrR family transcriptional regulator
MRRLGDELGMRAPSLYKHIAGKDDIEVALQARGLAGLAQALAPTAGDITALAAGYRSWALAHPRLYELMTRRPLSRDRLPEGLEDAAAQPLLITVGGDMDRARALWGLAHGLIDLELAGRFPPDADLDAAWAAAVSALEGHRPRSRRRTAEMTETS